MDTVDIELKPLFPHTIPTNADGRNFFLLGPHRSGKTTTLEYLLFCRHQYYRRSFGLVLAGSIDSVERLAKFWPECLIVREYNKTKLKQFLLDAKECNERHRRQGRKDKMRPFFLVLDDTGFDPKIWLDPTLKEILMNGRHYRIDAYMCVQYIKTLKPDMRAQCDYIFMHKNASPEDHRKMFEVFASAYFPRLQGFRDVFMSLTRYHWSIVIRNMDQSTDPDADPFDEGVRKCRAPNPDEEGLPRFRLGDKSIWHYAAKLEAARKRKKRNKESRRAGNAELLSMAGPRTRVRVRRR